MTLMLRPGMTIRRPRREVAAVMFDPAQEESWLETLRLVGDPEARDAAVRERAIRLLLREETFAFAVTQEPERFLELRADTPFPTLIRMDLESIPEGTLVRIRVQITLRGLPRLLRPLVGRRLRRSLLGDLAALKHVVETHPDRGGLTVIRPVHEVATAEAPPAAPPPVGSTLPPPQPTGPPRRTGGRTIPDW